MKKSWSRWETFYLWGMLIGCAWSDFNNDLHEITAEIVTKYFQMFKCVTYITDEQDNWDYVRWTNQIFLVKISDSEDEVLSYNALLTESYEQGCGGYVIQVSGKMRASMVHHLKNAKEKAINYRYNKQRYLFLPAEEGDMNLDLFNQKIMFFFPNLLVLIPKKGSSGFSIISHTIFDFYKQNTTKQSHEVLDTWSVKDGFKRKVDLYPDRIRNVRGKNMRFVLVNYEPYALILRNGNNTVFDGLETRIAQLFVKTINGTWDAMDSGPELWGDFFPNGSANGLLGAVQRHDADFGFAAIYQWNCKQLDCSFSYAQAGVTCLVPKPQLVSGWYTILIPFGLSTWIALTVAYFLISLFVLFITRTANNIRGIKNSDFFSMGFESFFNVFRLQLEQIPQTAHQNTPVAVYIRVSTLYYYFVAAFWQGVIATFLMAPQYEKPINTARDMVENYPQLKWGASTDSWILAVAGATDPVLKAIIDNYVILSDEELRKRPIQRDFAFFTERLPHGHYGFSDYINKENMPYLRTMETDIYKGNTVTVMPRDCPYAEYYDYVVSWMFDTGIVHKIEDQWHEKSWHLFIFVGSRYFFKATTCTFPSSLLKIGGLRISHVSLEAIDNSLQLMIKTSNEKERHGTTELSLRHLEGPLYIYAIGMSISTAVFIVEIKYSKLKLRKKKSSALLF